MKIEVLGVGCAKCTKLHELVQRVVADTGCGAEVHKVEKLDDIMKHGVARLPALVVDGTVRAAGAIPKAAQIKAWIMEG